MEWLENTRTQSRTEFDGEVVIQLMKNNKYQFKFRKNSFHKIAPDGEYFVIAKDENKIYFKESEKGKGFHLLEWSTGAKYFQIKAERLQLRQEDLGEYNLEFDSKLGLHYICFARKLEKTLKWETK